jgi:hypothetical protein
MINTVLVHGLGCPFLTNLQDFSDRPEYAMVIGFFDLPNEIFAMSSLRIEERPFRLSAALRTSQGLPWYLTVPLSIPKILPMKE